MTEDKELRKELKKSYKKSIGIIVAILLIAATIIAVIDAMHYQSTEDAYIENHPVSHWYDEGCDNQRLQHWCTADWSGNADSER